jgi:hypothetical protein
MGRAGRAGGIPGDLFLEVRLRRPFLQTLIRAVRRLFRPGT